MVYKIAVIGEREIVAGFQALGLDAFPADGAHDALRILRELTGENSGYAIIYLTETFAAPLAAEIEKFVDRAIPAVILIPGRGGSRGIGLAALKSSVERAVGADIL